MQGIIYRGEMQGIICIIAGVENARNHLQGGNARNNLNNCRGRKCKE